MTPEYQVRLTALKTHLRKGTFLRWKQMDDKSYSAPAFCIEEDWSDNDLQKVTVVFLYVDDSVGEPIVFTLEEIAKGGRGFSISSLTPIIELEKVT